jgi:signal transduction histidine kinase
VRYLLGPRLQASGIDLAWDVGSLPTMTGWSARESHQLQMLLFEAFGNLMAHAQATQASLGARLIEGAEGRAIEIELRDNGRGFDTQAVFAGKGLTNMRSRAVALGGTLTVRSQPGETSLRLHLPVPVASSGPEIDRSTLQPANGTLR